MQTGAYQYMRIQGRENSWVTKYPKGVFSLCWNLIRDKVMTEEEEQLFISIDNWFKDHLPEPERADRRGASGRGDPPAGRAQRAQLSGCLRRG